VTTYLNWKQKNVALLKFFDFYKSLIIGGSLWLLTFSSLGNLNDQLAGEKEVIYQQWQQQKNEDRLGQIQIEKHSKYLDRKYLEIVELSQKIKADRERADRTIDIHYSDRSNQRAKMQDRAVVLTFDDGPSRHTLRILDLLKKYQVKATFFVTGITIKYGCDTLKKIYNQGHEIANHTYDHSYLPGKSINAQKWQIETTEKAIQKCLGINYHSRWFRAPYGAQDSNTIKVARKLGLNTALWTVDTNDWRSTVTTDSIINTVTKSQSKDIVLMHDTSKKTADAIEPILLYLSKYRYKFLTISDAFRIEDKELAGIEPFFGEQRK